ncbi:SRPBCC family protein [Allonocardiopsis opalescens]|uniref:Polyketide cyclase/dehydrase/lipid transport protein n=1 Tax=Allonocardiopsis opalescens TaxID=1144618 RepID=A0A2T0PZR9_9ACTN|nr:SRPBCC family protein [Allonocardiopsis opalescens]PRX97027.1 polyketide cyclase/dehydrase/lipid transport protein [Allonocardiopsis opalescens]
MADRTRSSITINAGTADVLAVIADFPRYPEWADGVKDAGVESVDGEGRPERVRFALDAGVIKDRYVLAYDWTADGVRWRMAEPGSVLAELAGGYTLRGSGGRTEVEYELAADIAIPLPGLVKRQAERRIVDTALKGLKRRVERGG